MRKGILYAVGAYLVWGIVPIYWKSLSGLSPVQLIGHRIVWSCVMLFGVILASGQRKEFKQAASNRRVLLMYGMAGLLVAANWLVYVWAVNAGFIVQTSLGYFINPLVSIFLGVFVLGERLRLGQWIPIALAAAGVLYLTIALGALPWISLTLAVTFALYGLVKKTAPLGSVYGLTLETGLLLLPAAAYLFYVDQSGSGIFRHRGLITDMLLVVAGLITTIPLLLFASATRRIPLSLIGLFQYIAPTLQFLLGIFVYKEPFSRVQLVGFGAVWTALALLAIEGGIAYRTRLGAELPD